MKASRAGVKRYSAVVSVQTGERSMDNHAIVILVMCVVFGWAVFEVFRRIRGVSRRRAQIAESAGWPLVTAEVTDCFLRELERVGPHDIRYFELDLTYRYEID